MRVVNMSRRRFLAIGVAGLVLAAPATQAQSSGRPAVTFDLVMDNIYTQLADGETVFAVSFRDQVTRVVNPQLRVRQGDDVVIRLANHTDKPHAFEIMSVAGTKSAPIPAGGSVTVRFKAPARGAYIYHDPLQARGEGARTLFGDFIVTR